MPSFKIEPDAQAPVNVMVTVSFQADSQGDAADKIKGWKLHEGCTLSASIPTNPVMGQTDKSGKVQAVPPLEPLSPTQPTPTEASEKEPA